MASMMMMILVVGAIGVAIWKRCEIFPDMCKPESKTDPVTGTTLIRSPSVTKTIPGPKVSVLPSGTAVHGSDPSKKTFPCKNGACVNPPGRIGNFVPRDVGGGVCECHYVSAGILAAAAAYTHAHHSKTLGQFTRRLSI